MTTPYGTTYYDFTIDNIDPDEIYRTVQITDPMGQKEKAEFNFGDLIADQSCNPSTPQGIVGECAYYYYRNTLYWDKKAMEEGPNDFNKAKLYHWFHWTGDPKNEAYTTLSNILMSIKPALRKPDLVQLSWPEPRYYLPHVHGMGHRHYHGKAHQNWSGAFRWKHAVV